MWEKSKGTTKCEKKTVTSDKNRTDAMLVLLNITMTPSNLRKIIIIIREPLYMTKVLSNVILELHNVIMESSNVRKINKWTTKCEKRTIKCDVGII